MTIGSTPSQRAWRERARCLGHRHPWLWFSNQPHDVRTARAMCFSCPVRSMCLADQLALEQKHRQTYDGMFGGRTEKERKVILKFRGAVVV